MEKEDLLNTREVAHFLDINEKVVYHLIADKGLPATKVTGKWLFPKHLVERWLESETINYPTALNPLPPYHGLLIISGSNDVLLDRTISLYNRLFPGHFSVFGNVGSQGGLRVLSRGLCHIAASHLLHEDDRDYNFDFASHALKGEMPAVVNFCQREQGLFVKKDNPCGIKEIGDLARPSVSIANRPLGTAPGVRPVATLMDLGFIPLRWERYDLLIHRDRFFEQGIQLFLGFLHEAPFRELANDLEGYDLSLCGKVVFPQHAKTEGQG
jgi:putative molybdopterin biosynthesis protein